MSYASEMLSAASLAGPELHEGAGEVLSFIKSRELPSGEFMGRGDKGDIYYTVFGIDCMMALGEQADKQKTTAYLSSFKGGEGLDLMHLGCLARCWSRLDLDGLAPGHAEAILGRVEQYRSADGGYHIEKGAGHGSIYGCFMAFAAYQDLGRQPADPDRIADSICRLRMKNGLYASEFGLNRSTTNAAVGALLLLGSLGRPVEESLSRWLFKQCHEKGGFVAAPGVPVPDLVSTATALFALRRAGVDLAPVKKECINFLGSVWEDDGGFSGSWMDNTADCEYTFYALLSLGCLAEVGEVIGDQ